MYKRQIYITHDQGEALTMSDRIAVMNQGRVEQVGDGRDVYDHPKTPFVAAFVGENNGFSGKVSALEGGWARLETPFGALQGRAGGGLAPGDLATLFVRPEALRLAEAGATPDLTAEVVGAAFEGSVTHIALRAGVGHPLTMALTRGLGAHTLEPGAQVGLSFAREDAVALPTERSA